jgi:hypothetical protein
MVHSTAFISKKRGNSFPLLTEAAAQESRPAESLMRAAQQVAEADCRPRRESEAQVGEVESP